MRSIPLLIALVALQVQAPTPAWAAEQSPSPSAVANQRVRKNFQWIRENKGYLCKRFLQINAILGVGFFLGRQWDAPSPDPIVINEYKVPVDHPQFAVVENREVFGVVDGAIVDARRNPVPGGGNTESIFSFRGYLYGLNPKGDLFVYRPAQKKWFGISSPGFKEARATEGAIVGLTKEGEVFVFTSPLGERVGFDSGTPHVGGQLYEFTSVGKGFETLKSQTPLDKFNPETVFAIGEDILMIHKDGTVEVVKKGSPEHADLSRLLDLL